MAEQKLLQWMLDQAASRDTADTVSRAENTRCGEAGWEAVPAQDHPGTSQTSQVALPGSTLALPS